MDKKEKFSVDKGGAVPVDCLLRVGLSFNWQDGGFWLR